MAIPEGMTFPGIYHTGGVKDGSIANIDQGRIFGATMLLAFFDRAFNIQRATNMVAVIRTFAVDAADMAAFDQFMHGARRNLTTIIGDKPSTGAVAGDVDFAMRNCSSQHLEESIGIKAEGFIWAHR